MQQFVLHKNKCSVIFEKLKFTNKMNNLKKAVREHTFYSVVFDKCDTRRNRNLIIQLATKSSQV